MRASPWALLLALAAGASASEAPTRLTVFHTNDIHGWFMARPDWKEKERLIGGLPAAARAMAKLREGGQPSLFVDAGDWFQGTPEGTLTRGVAMAELFNAMKLDATVVGNHEYDLGEAALRELIPRIEAPVLGANVFDKASGARAAYLKPWVLREVEGVKVGIFGVMTSHMDRFQFAKNVAGLEFRDEVESARTAVAELRAAGATVIIGLTHVGRDAGRISVSPSELDIAAKVPGIDLLVGGHIHVPIAEPARIGPSGTLHVNTGSFLTSLGRVVLTIDRATKKVVASEGGLVKLWVDELGEDPAIKAVGARHQEAIGRLLDVVIATAAADLPRSLEGEGALGNWVTDCTRKWTKTEVAIHNATGIRAHLAAGPVRLRHMHEIMPFDNLVTTLYLRGSDLRAALEHGSGVAPGIVQVSGVRFVYDPKAPAGGRVVSAEVGGAPLRDDALYSVSAPDFLVEGGDGYAALGRGADKAVTPSMMREVLSWCAVTHGPIRPVLDGRVAAR